MRAASNDLHYDPHAGPEPMGWRAATRDERTTAIRAWLRDSGLPPSKTGRESVERWLRVEDALASSQPGLLADVIGRLIETGIERTTAVWATSELVSIDDDPNGPPVPPGIEQLLEPTAIEILPAAYEAWQVGLNPAHLAVIAHYNLYLDPQSSMTVATAAGFCFGCAASPKFVRNHVLHQHFLGGELHTDAAEWLPVIHAYDELFRYVSDAVFEQTDPIPPDVRPPVEAMACFDSSFSDWCKGFLQAGPVVEDAWISHLDRHPRLWADYTDTVDTIGFFASREHANKVIASSSSPDVPLEEAGRKRRAGLEAAATRLFVLAQPVLDQDDAD
jgi:hypothetical protein